MQVVLFDIDGTLISTLRAGLNAMEASLAEGFQVSGAIDETQISGRTDRSIARSQFLRHGIEDSQANWQCFVDGYLRRLPDSLCTQDGRILPGIAALLEILHDRDDLALGLLTGNVPGGAEIKLEHFGIYRFFGFGGFGDRHNSRDDVARDAMRVVEDRLPGGISPRDIFVVGDTPFDIACARAIGARAVAVATGVHSVDQLRAAAPDHLFQDLTDAERFLYCLAGST